MLRDLKNDVVCKSIDEVRQSTCMALGEVLDSIKLFLSQQSNHYGFNKTSCKSLVEVPSQQRVYKVTYRSKVILYNSIKQLGSQ